MFQVLDAFRSLLGDDDSPITESEFIQFWKTCSPKLRFALRVDAGRMGFHCWPI